MTDDKDATVRQTGHVCRACNGHGFIAGPSAPVADAGGDFDREQYLDALSRHGRTKPIADRIRVADAGRQDADAEWSDVEWLEWYIACYPEGSASPRLARIAARLRTEPS